MVENESGVLENSLQMESAAVLSKAVSNYVEEKIQKETPEQSLAALRRAGIISQDDKTFVWERR